MYRIIPDEIFRIADNTGYRFVQDTGSNLIPGWIPDIRYIPIKNCILNKNLNI